MESAAVVIELSSFDPVRRASPGENRLIKDRTFAVVVSDPELKAQFERHYPDVLILMEGAAEDPAAPPVGDGGDGAGTDLLPGFRPQISLRTVLRPVAVSSSAVLFSLCDVDTAPVVFEMNSIDPVRRPFPDEKTLISERNFGVAVSDPELKKLLERHYPDVVLLRNRGVANALPPPDGADSVVLGFRAKLCFRLYSFYELCESYAMAIFNFLTPQSALKATVVSLALVGLGGGGMRRFDGLLADIVNLALIAGGAAVFCYRVLIPNAAVGFSFFVLAAAVAWVCLDGASADLSAVALVAVAFAIVLYDNPDPSRLESWNNLLHTVFVVIQTALGIGAALHSSDLLVALKKKLLEMGFTGPMDLLIQLKKKIREIIGTNRVIVVENQEDALGSGGVLSSDMLVALKRKLREMGFTGLREFFIQLKTFIMRIIGSNR